MLYCIKMISHSYLRVWCHPNRNIGKHPFFIRKSRRNLLIWPHSNLKMYDIISTWTTFAYLGTCNNVPTSGCNAIPTKRCNTVLTCGIVDVHYSNIVSTCGCNIISTSRCNTVPTCGIHNVHSTTSLPVDEQGSYLWMQHRPYLWMQHRFYLWMQQHLNLGMQHRPYECNNIPTCGCDTVSVHPVNPVDVLVIVRILGIIVLVRKDCS
jgi:hypothetical protein